MSPDSRNIDAQENLFDRLQSLLEKQDEMIRKNNFYGVQMLCKQADSIIAQLDKTPAMQSTQTKERHNQLIKKYKKLELMIETEKDSILRQFQKLVTGKKTIRMYYNNF